MLPAMDPRNTTPPPPPPPPPRPSSSPGAWTVPDPARAWRHAAIWTWAAAGALLVVFLPCAGFYVLVGLLPEGQFQKLLDGLREAEGASFPDSFERQNPWLVAGAVVAALLGTPAAALGVLGWGVWRGRQRWVRPTTGVLLAVSGLVGVLLLLAVVQGQVASAVLGLLLLGGPLTVCGLAVRALWRAAHEEHLAPPTRGEAERADTNREPWDGW